MEQLRRELAVATRMLVDAGILNYSGHLSARVGGEAELLIQPVDEPRAGLRPEGVLRVRFDGTVVEGDGSPPSELAIHVGIYEARPDVGAVAHFHHDPTTAFSVVEGVAIVPVKNHASRWAAGVPVHPDPSHISTPEQGAALAATLGSAHAALLRSHGEVVVAEDVTSCFTDVVHFVENADTLARARALGPVTPLGPEECERFLATFRRGRHARKVWRYATAVAVAAGSVPGSWLEDPPGVAAAGASTDGGLLAGAAAAATTAVTSGSRGRA
ncbi:MAG: class II aldolase/adducin family protein [Acidimicrobiales bacterium]